MKSYVNQSAIQINDFYTMIRLQRLDEHHLKSAKDLFMEPVIEGENIYRKLIWRRLREAVLPLYR